MKSYGHTRRRALLSVDVLFLMGSLFTAVIPNGAVAAEARAFERSKAKEELLRAFTPLAEKTRYSLVKIDCDGVTVALGAFISRDGRIVTKASQLGSGRLTCWVAGGKELEAEWVAQDDDSDLAIVRIKRPTQTFQPVVWSEREPMPGQWAITPGIESVPHAVGVVSVLPRPILPRRAFIGVQLAQRSSAATIGEILEGFGAEEVGLKRGDVILGVNGINVESGEEFIELMRRHREGEVVQLRVQRGSEEFVASVTLRAPKSELVGRFDSRSRMRRMEGEVSTRSLGFELALQHDSVLQPWLCGGPLLNLNGEAMGLNISRAGRVASYALPGSLVQQIVNRMLERVSPATQ